MNTEQTIALLIDADNAQEKKMENVILEISTFGRIVVKRAYGNWTKDTLKNGKKILENLQ
ncbi:MAG: NYN domain-containing protein [Treponema sp.]|nr:NYN domain-containing protein [Treponema sp.]